MLKAIKSPISAIASVLLFGALLILLLWVNVQQQLAKEKELTINKTKQLNSNQALALESYTIRTIQNADLILQIVRTEYQKTNSFPNLEHLQKNSSVDQKLLEGVVILNARGDLVSSYHSFHPDTVTNFSFREYFQVHSMFSNDSLYISKPINSKLFSRAVVVLSRKITGENNKLAGVVALQVFPETFTSFSDGAFVDSFDIISLIAPDGITYARKTGSVASYGEIIIKSPLFEHLRNKPADSYYAKDAIRGIPTFFSYRKLKNYPIIATVGKREADVMKEYKQQKKKALIFTTAITLLISLFSGAIILGIQNKRRFYTAIAESEQKYRLMFENSKDAILLAGTDGTILALNSAAYKVFTINGPLIKVINISDLLSTQTDRIKDSSLFYQKSSFSGEINFKRYDESVFTAEVVSSQYKSEPNKWVSVIVVRDITERKLLEEELAKERNLREQLIMQQVIQTQEMEREQIGGELHDNICQILATTKHYLELIERKQEFSQTFLPQARQMINDSILEIRHLSHAMNPPALQSKNITDALKDLAASVKATGKLEVAFYANDNLELLNLQKKRALFRIAQEQLNNVLKHAEATEAIVNIQLFGNEIHLRITDNGKGFDPMQHKAGLGLNNMEARVKAFAGRIFVTTEPGKGCCIEAVIPYIDMQLS